MNTAAQVANMIAGWKSSGISKTDLVVNIADAEVGWPYAWGSTGQYCTTANRKAKMANQRISEGDKELIRKRCQVLNGSRTSCDGCAFFPDGEKTRMYDCIGFINSLLDYADISHYGAGCTIMWNHAANWTQKGKIANLPEQVCLVFQQEPGNPDKMQHIGLYIGNGLVIHCSGTVKKQQLSAYPWTHYGVLKGLGGDVPVPTPTHRTLRKGDKGDDVVYLQTKLIQLGYSLPRYGADGSFGNETLEAVKNFQRVNGLEADGVVGTRTWDALENASSDLYTVTIPHLGKAVADKIVQTYGGSMVIEKKGVSTDG